MNSKISRHVSARLIACFFAAVFFARAKAEPGSAGADRSAPESPIRVRLELQITLKGSHKSSERTAGGDAKIAKSDGVAGSTTISVGFREKSLLPPGVSLPPQAHAQAPKLYIPEGTFLCDLSHNYRVEKTWERGNFRPPLGRGVAAGGRRSSGGYEKRLTLARFTACARWQGKKKFQNYYTLIIYMFHKC